jgi:hypothetical protein
MPKKQKVLDFTSKEPLIERLRRLWAHAEAIEIAQKRGKPLPNDVSEWLHRALKNIACGMDANEAFNVRPEKPGVRKDIFLRELQKKIANGYIASSGKELKQGSKPKKVAVAIKEISQALPDIKESTVRKNWNQISTVRKQTFTIGKK